MLVESSDFYAEYTFACLVFLQRPPKYSSNECGHAIALSAAQLSIPFDDFPATQRGDGPVVRGDKAENDGKTRHTYMSSYLCPVHTLTSLMHPLTN